MAKLTGVVETPRGEARKALAKAVEFTEAARADIEAARWNAAGLAAVHSGIAAADAALIASAGVRSTSQDHGAVIPLLEAQIPEFKAEQRRQLGGLLKKKNQVAYEQRPLTEIEARTLVDHAGRLAQWATGVVKKQQR
ncbi:MAG: hypothetical protein Q7W30_09725 [Coriobacteriia bacterium]|nr:hypothetical protein [Coriobacteriia bacterium]